MKNCVTTSGSSIIDIGDTTGIVVGMRIGEYAYNTTNFTNGRLNDNINEITTNRATPQNSYVKSIVDGSRIEIGFDNSWKSSYVGSAAVALRGTTTYLHFSYPKTASTLDSDNNLRGAWSALPATKDPSVLQDPTTWGSTNGYPECSGVANTIIGYFSLNFDLLLNSNFIGYFINYYHY